MGDDVVIGNGEFDLDGWIQGRERFWDFRRPVRENPDNRRRRQFGPRREYRAGWQSRRHPTRLVDMTGIRASHAFHIVGCLTEFPGVRGPELN